MTLWLVFLSLLFQSIPFPIPGAPSVPASTPWVTGQALGTLRSNFTGCVGSLFTVGAAPITVTDIGRWVVAGNAQTHTVVLQNLAGTNLGSVGINASSGAGAFKFGAITPVVLSASTQYIVFSNETNGGDQWYDLDTTLTVTSVAANADPVNAGTCPNASFASAGAPPEGYVPINFKYHL